MWHVRLLEVGLKLDVLTSTDALLLDYDATGGGERGEERGEFRQNLFLIFESEEQCTLLIRNHGPAQYGTKGLNAAEQLVPGIDHSLVTLF